MAGDSDKRGLLLDHIIHNHKWRANPWNQCGSLDWRREDYDRPDDLACLLALRRRWQSRKYTVPNLSVLQGCNLEWLVILCTLSSTSVLC